MKEEEKYNVSFGVSFAARFHCRYPIAFHGGLGLAMVKNSVIPYGGYVVFM